MLSFSTMPEETLATGVSPDVDDGVGVTTGVMSGNGVVGGGSIGVTSNNGVVGDGSIVVLVQPTIARSTKIDMVAPLNLTT